MTVSDFMSQPVISIGQDEPVSAAAGMMERCNVGSLPVTDRGGRLCGIVTDRDLIVRCVARRKAPQSVTVREIMTAQPASVSPQTALADAAALMARQQVRRLPVAENGRLCGMLTLADLALHPAGTANAAACLGQICENVHRIASVSEIFRKNPENSANSI